MIKDTKDFITVVCQGGTTPETYQVIQNYLDNHRIFRVIYSGWPSTIFSLTHPKLTVVYNQIPENCGVGNRNYQIVSSYGGLQHVYTKFVWKARSDQIYGQDAINTYLDFFEKNFDPQYPKIFTPSLYTKNLFHIRDHMTLGTIDDIKNFWDCPLYEKNGEQDYNNNTRAETYFVCNYLKRYSSEVLEAISNPSKFLHDNAPKWKNMLELSNRIMPEYFSPLPRVSFRWPKHYGEREYPYELELASTGEYQA